eukprot:scaffold357993_cov17-Prasinocladus_malaysianus.AAC.1
MEWILKRSDIRASAMIMFNLVFKQSIWDSEFTEDNATNDTWLTYSEITTAERKVGFGAR